MLSELGVDQVEFGRLAGASKSVVSQWLSGGIKSINPKFAYSIEKNCGYSAQWVMTGDGEKKLSLPLADTQISSPGAQSLGPTLINLTEHPDLCPIKRVNFKLAAGVHGYALEVDNGDAAPVFFRKDWIKMNGYNAERLVAFRVKGQSMEPSLWDGDLVVVNLADTKPYDGDVYAVSYEGEPGVKRLRRDAGEWWLASDNADQRKFSPKRCTEDVEILGRVIYKQSERI